MKNRSIKRLITSLFIALAAVMLMSAAAFAETDPGFAEDSVFFANKSNREIVEYITEQMLKRNDTISISFPYGGEGDAELAEGFFKEAHENRGPGTGDYLSNSYGSMRCEISSRYDDSGEGITNVIYHIDFYTTADQEERVNQKLEEIATELKLGEKDEYEGVLAVYNYITSHVKYDYEHLNDNSYTIKHTAFAALFAEKAVCQGYAALFYRLTNDYVSKARIISGTADTGEAHAWNIVKIGNKYYNVDCTWDTGRSFKDYDYFLKCDAKFSDHIRDAEFVDDGFYALQPMAKKDYAVSSGSEDSGENDSSQEQSGNNDSDSDDNKDSGDSGNNDSSDGNSNNSDEQSSDSQTTDDKTAPAEDHANETGIDETPIGMGASAEAADKAIKSLKSDSDPKGAKFAPLMLKTTKQTGTSIKLTWKKVKGASKYVIYGSKCGSSNKPKKIATVKGSGKTVKKAAGKKLKKGTYYKFIVVALDSNNKVVSTSKIIHAATKDKANYTKVTTKAKNNKVSLKKGKSFLLGAKAVGKKVKKHVGLRYESSNPKVTKVSKSGKITAKKKGTCKIYVYAQNGVSKIIKVTVR
ncbi:MAG: transglutaminase domain-containing protein [Mogibacterium sp.]|nr:transglutaminase domain-containing protein [Mogibacterium sp.]MBR0340840.1 transglutaminase domain-containing protein [Oscillospiraceae bacterium]